jgi:lipopolysaccharide/colanic/teichoic acid biosynthesis glycosyltransferase
MPSNHKFNRLPQAFTMSYLAAAQQTFAFRFSLWVSQWHWHLTRHTQKRLKRALDIAVVLPALVLLAPLFAVVALIIRFTDGGPALFWQRRVGLNGKEFGFPKFRSMCVNAEALRKQIEATNQHGSDGVTFKMRNDPRITPIGRWIRRFSVDELPQLWCVLKGDMSLVGPRPALVNEVARYTQAERERLTVLPGLTCYWQVMGRADIPFPQQVALDVRYIREQSFWLDLRLLAATVPAVLLGRGAY